MHAVKIKRRLTAPIPEFPEFTPMVGKNVEITIVEDLSPPNSASYDFWEGQSAEAAAAQQGVKPVVSLDQLRSSEDVSDAFEGFEETIAQWRREPWQSGDDNGLSHR